MEYSPMLYLRLLTGTDSVSQEHFNFNFATVDSALQDFEKLLDSFDPQVTDEDLKKLATYIQFSSETLAEIGASVVLNSAQLQWMSQSLTEAQLETLASYLSISPEELEEMVKKLSDAQLQAMGESVSLTEEQIQIFLGDVELTESQLATILNGANQETLQEIADKINLSVSDLQEICEKLSDSQLETMGESVSLTEEQIQTFLGDVELTESQLATILNHANQETLQEIADKINLSVSDLQGICEKLNDSQLEKMGESVSLTEEQIQTFLGDVELTESQLATILNGANQETLQEIADKINLSVSDLQGICEKLNDSQLEKMGESVSLTEEQIQTFLGDVELTESQLASVINGANQETLQEIADKIEFSQEVLDSLKGEKGDKAEFTEEQQGLIEAAILGAAEKQEKMSLIETTTDVIKESDSFFLLQDGQVKKIIPQNFAEYINSFATIPEFGKSLNDYTWAEIWQIAQLGKMQDYFKIGDRKTWISNRLVTTCQIADFNYDVKNVETGQRANVTFVLNDYVEATTTEVNSIYMSSKSSFIPYNPSCLAPVIELQENGSITADLLPGDLVGLVTPVYKAYAGSAWMAQASDGSEIPEDKLYLSYFSPIGFNEIYLTSNTSIQDRFTGTSKKTEFSLFASQSANLASLFLNKQVANVYLRGQTPNLSSYVAYLTSTGGMTSGSSFTISTTNNATARRLVVSFCMG